LQSFAIPRFFLTFIWIDTLFGGMNVSNSSPQHNSNNNNEDGGSGFSFLQADSQSLRRDSHKEPSSTEPVSSFSFISETSSSHQDSPSGSAFSFMASSPAGNEETHSPVAPQQDLKLNKVAVSKQVSYILLVSFQFSLFFL
jgi:hypothetical protein